VRFKLYGIDMIVNPGHSYRTLNRSAFVRSNLNELCRGCVREQSKGSIPEILGCSSVWLLPDDPLSHQ
jgi:hypothetical protein